MGLFSLFSGSWGEKKYALVVLLLQQVDVSQLLMICHWRHMWRCYGPYVLTYVVLNYYVPSYIFTSIINYEYNYLFHYALSYCQDQSLPTYVADKLDYKFQVLLKKSWELVGVFPIGSFILTLFHILTLWVNIKKHNDSIKIPSNGC